MPKSSQTHAPRLWTLYSTARKLQGPKPMRPSARAGQQEKLLQQSPCGPTGQQPPLSTGEKSRTAVRTQHSHAQTVGKHWLSRKSPELHFPCCSSQGTEGILQVLKSQEKLWDDKLSKPKRVNPISTESRGRSCPLTPLGKLTSCNKLPEETVPGIRTGSVLGLWYLLQDHTFQLCMDNFK
ncbi:hypothetical protein MJG53_009165 [Ovis ammon polii x Ovis aries]|uniref:Uncharacterized protein n=1 Tax=Ovis ammon polii x Ovis aries TaxID=2918886 RepID=A0ACB9UYL9_9CETA|nr:hypothetical protein MJG53_009165 [Ovis ammon polii x Ovis aries]